MQGPVVRKPISANSLLNIIMASKFRLSFSKPCRLHSSLNICYLIYLRRYIYKLYSDFKNYYWEKRWISTYLDTFPDEEKRIVIISADRILLSCGNFWEMRYVMMMMMNCYCGVVDWWKALSLISSREYCQRSSPSRISNTQRAGFEPASSGFVEWSCASSDNHYTKSKSWGCYWIKYIFNHLPEFIKPYW